MRRKNLMVATIIGLSLTLLTACGGSEESKETTVRKTEAESSITVVDNVTTEESTTSDLTTETTTLVVDNETTGEETTTVKVEDTSKQETTTKEETTTAKPTTTQKETTTKQETTTVKSTTTQKETTTKEQETTTQKETTTKPQETTTKEEETTTKEEETTEVWNKSVYEEAAIKLIKFLNNGGKSEGFLGWYEYREVASFEDLNLDGVPELLLLGYSHDYSGNIYIYSNGEYAWYRESKGYASSNSKLYKNSLGEIIIYETYILPNYTEDGESYYLQEAISLFNVTRNEREGLVAKVYNGDDTVRNYQKWDDESGMVGGYNITKEEYDNIYNEAMSGLTYYKNTCVTDVWDVIAPEDYIKEAYEKYLSNK